MFAELEQLGGNVPLCQEGTHQGLHLDDLLHLDFIQPEQVKERSLK
jgi:hypothetical protein